MRLDLDYVAKTIVNFIAENYLDDEVGLDSRTPLISLNILDSASLFDVVDFIKSEFSVHMPLEEIHPENFACAEVLGMSIIRLAQQEESA